MFNRIVGGEIDERAETLQFQHLCISKNLAVTSKVGVLHIYQAGESFEKKLALIFVYTPTGSIQYPDLLRAR
jgi:hypothetical protein